MPLGDSRPRQPHLSAAAAKTSNRLPLTPKVAAAQSASRVSPLGRRPLSQTPALAGSQPHRDAASTPPVASFVGAHVTPRSGHRQNRVDSASSTPTGTPNPDRGCEVWESSRAAWSTPTLPCDAPKPLSPSEPRSDANDSKFFYASDARHSQAQQPRLTPSLPKSATFFYANGTSDGPDNNDAIPCPGHGRGKPRPSPPASFTPVLGATPEPAASAKFFFANGAPNAVAAKQTQPVSGPGSASTSSAAPKWPLARSCTSSSPAVHSAHAAPGPQRPPSPAKPPLTPAAETPPPTLSSHASASRQPRVSIAATPRPFRGHVRAGSVPVVQAAARTVTSPQQPTSASSSPPLSPDSAPHPTVTMTTILQAVESLADGPEERASEPPPPETRSPTKSGHPSEAVSELIASARRERKVQDLEITNASLEAINRTLERQLRKQTAELRRYRRLSRSGRFSLASGQSSRVGSETLTKPAPGLSDVSEAEDSDDDDEEAEPEEEPDSLDDSELSSADSGSPGGTFSPSDRTLARRKRDERRLQLDLSKHQQLLIDSQKINQSIKRCLDWTEVLIKEGHKALEYHVRVSDIRLGGHVLAPPDDDDEDDVDGRKGEGEQDLSLPPQGLPGSVVLGIEPP